MLTIKREHTDMKDVIDKMRERELDALTRIISKTYEAGTI